MKWALLAALVVASAAVAQTGVLYSYEPERSTRVGHVRVVDDGAVRCYVLDARRASSISCVVLPYGGTDLQ